MKKKLLVSLASVITAIALTMCALPPSINEPAAPTGIPTPIPTAIPDSETGMWQLPNSTVFRVEDNMYNVVCYIYSYSNSAGYGDHIDITSNGGIFCIERVLD